jgi:hypothetical protein
MTRVPFVLPLLILAASATAAAQPLSGEYLHAGPQGAVSLTLRESADGSLAGRLTGADGSVLRLDGAAQAGRATGRISTADGTGWFAAGFEGSRLVLLVAELDAVTGQPDLQRSWRLEFTRAAAAAPPAAPGSTPPTAAEAGQPDPFGRPDDSPLAREWRDMLRGAKLTRISSYASGTAGGGGYSEHWEAFLCSDGMLHFRDGSVTSYGDVGAYSARQGDGAGRWEVVAQGGRVYLASQFEGQPVRYGELTFDPSNRATHLDGKRFYITRTDNHVCR